LAVNHWRFALHWAASFGEYRETYNSNTTFYGALWALGAEINDAISNTLVGGRPAMNIKDPADPQKSKRRIAHEYGHLQTITPILQDPLLLS